MLSRLRLSSQEVRGWSCRWNVGIWLVLGERVDNLNTGKDAVDGYNEGHATAEWRRTHRDTVIGSQQAILSVSLGRVRVQQTTIEPCAKIAM